MLVLINVKNLLRSHKKSLLELKNWSFPKKSKRKALYITFTLLVAVSMFYIEFAVAYMSPQPPLKSIALYVNPKGNVMENALGRLTITDDAHFLLNGCGSYKFYVCLLYTSPSPRD